MIVAVAYLKCSNFQGWLPEVLRVPVQAAWFGALGGIIISLKGVYDHAGGKPANQWDNSYDLWHLGRPLSGAVAGGITYLLLRAINQSDHLTEPVVYAGAFILGTQERRFFNFLSEVGRLVVQVPDETKTPTFQLGTIQPAQGAAGETVLLCGHGFAPGLTVAIGGRPAGQVVVAADGTSVAGVLPAHDAGPVDIAITNPTGESATLPRAFTYIAPAP
ncbi:MAG TPA: IPT/TIG domain-containing protein [Stellaceae bacterium]